MPVVARRQETQQFLVRSHRVPEWRGGFGEKSRAAPDLRCSRPLAGRRIAMATQPAVVAGGSTICTRSPVGKDAESSGEVASTRCWVEFATNLANRLHHSKSAKGNGSRCHPLRVSTKASSGTVDTQFRDF